METAGLHQLRFYPREVPSHPSPEYLGSVTRKLFGLPLSSFVVLRDTTVNKRKYRHGYTFENKILLLVGDYTKRYPLTIDINGGAFDHGCINVEKISSIIEQDYIISALHAKIDTDETPFKKLFKAYQEDSVTTSCRKGSDRQSNSRTIIFGSDPQYTLYEAGLFHPELGDKHLTRHELKFKGTQAQQFFSQWRKDPENLAALIKGFITGTFKIKFRDFNSSDSNICRRPLLPIWDKWLSSSTPRHFDRVEPTAPLLANQRKTWKTKLLNLKIELGEQVYSEILASVESEYKHSEERNSSGEQQLELLL